MLDPFEADRKIGAVYRVEATSVDLTLPGASERPLSYHGGRLGRGEVGEFVVIDVGGVAIFGRVAQVWLPESERYSVDPIAERPAVHPVGRVALLATLHLNGLQSRGIARHPRVGDPVYSASAEVLGAILADVSPDSCHSDAQVIRMGTLASNDAVTVDLTPSRLFGRHLAVLGATGSGKSWTVAHLVEEVDRIGGKLLLIDATGEFHTLGTRATHAVIGGAGSSDGHKVLSMPHWSMSESDLHAFLRPSGAAQLPKLREAVRSLRLAHALGSSHDLVDEDGCIRKAGTLRQPFLKAWKDHITEVEDEFAPFEFRLLPQQIQHECIFDIDQRDPERFGGRANNDLGYCTSLVARVYDILRTPQVIDVLAPQADQEPTLDEIDGFLEDDKQRILRLSLKDLPFTHFLREIVVNAIGRHLLTRARQGCFTGSPLLVCVDEAHQFFGQSVGDELSAVRLEHFESIAKEGRKYGLTVCMATQRPGDLPAGVISQAGMLLVHRLGDGRDRERVERASSELDKAATQLLPTLTPGEALFVGVDFPVPVAVRISPPLHAPQSDGPQYDTGWKPPDGIAQTATGAEGPSLADSQESSAG